MIIINNIIPRNFTGICKALIDESIRYYKNGMEHREDGPATEYKDGYKSWDFKNLPFFIGVSFYSYEGTIETL